jgi:Cft2 family RNA processing exonuclease
VSGFADAIACEFQTGTSGGIVPSRAFTRRCGNIAHLHCSTTHLLATYTGDFFLSNSRLVEGLPLEALRGLEPDVLIVEGSYGTARHPHRRNQENNLAERINQAIAGAKSVLMPVRL